MRTVRQRRGGEEEVEGGMTHQTAITRETVHARVARYSFWGVFYNIMGYLHPIPGLDFYRCTAETVIFRNGLFDA